MLTRVLRAYAAFHPELGYTQGMSSYAAVLLLYMTEEYPPFTGRATA